MHIFEFIIALLLAGAGLTVLSARIGAPYPALLALAGAGLALVPGAPTLVLEPELALTLFVAPVLLDAAFDASARDLRANWRPIAGLALGAVAFTICVVAAVARALVPTMPWAVAVALGAIVAPPDAAAATAVLKQLRPPHRLLVILEGESLFNDASALLIYRIAIGVAAAGALRPASVVPSVAWILFGSVALGLVMSRVVLALTLRIRDVALAVVMQFCGTFAVWMLAERLHLSGILTMVVFAMAASRHAPERTPASIRVPSYAVWELAVFVLNVLAFILVGFQLKAILTRIDNPTLVRYAGFAAVVCGATIVARLVWLSVAAFVSRWRQGSQPAQEPENERPIALSGRAAALVGWCGMRGIVTLAAALALPNGLAGDVTFPYRDLIVFTAFVVVLGTLVVQGATLRPLMRRLRIEPDDSVEREVRHARVEAFRAAVAATGDLPRTEMTTLLHRRYEVLLARVEADRRKDDGTSTGSEDEASRVFEEQAAFADVATKAARQRLGALRAEGTIGDAAYQKVQQELDLEELSMEQPGPAPA